jgi:hypothetical protein
VKKPHGYGRYCKFPVTFAHKIGIMPQYTREGTSRPQFYSLERGRSRRTTLPRPDMKCMSYIFIHLSRLLIPLLKTPAGGSLIWESSLSETMCQNTCVGSFLVHPVQEEQTLIISHIYKYHMRDIQSTSNDRDCSIYLHFFGFSSSMGIYSLSISITPQSVWFHLV